MLRKTLIAFACLGLTALPGMAADQKPQPKQEKPKHKETVDPAEAAQDPDFLIQGEFVSASPKFGVQVIAQGAGEFNAVVYPGGLPGDGWKKGDPKIAMAGMLKDGQVVFTGEKFDATLASGFLNLVAKDGKTATMLKRIERKSPTLGQSPSPGAMVIFNGSDTKKFANAKMTPENNLEAEATTLELPADYVLHLEFRLSYMPTARGQGRSNSGVYLHESYEIQVLDSFGLDGKDNECGGIYKVKEPDVNMCFPPLTWQTYDIAFTAPKYDAQSKKTSNARVTVRHNGVVIHENLELPQETPGRKKEGPAPRGIYLQGHGNHVQYRNIWLEPKK